MHQLETLIQAIPPAVFAAGGAVPGIPAPHSSADPTMNPLAAFASASHTYPTGVPPPSLHVFPLINPSTHFTHDNKLGDRRESPSVAFQNLLGHHHTSSQTSCNTDQLVEETSRMSLSPSYLYYDDEGYTRWQGETSGLPLLDVLVERHMLPRRSGETDQPVEVPWIGKSAASTKSDGWFPNRTTRRTDVNPENLWRLITSYIAPDLMDRCCLSFPVEDHLTNHNFSLVQCYLSTTYYVLPFIHVPTFLAVRAFLSHTLKLRSSHTYVLFTGLRKSSKMGRAWVCSSHSLSLLHCIASHG
jgi:hypothetical protein